MADFLPRADSALLAWMRHFNVTLLNDPQRFGVSNSDAAEMNDAVIAFDEAMKKVTPADRSKALVLNKNIIRARAKDVARRLVKRVRGASEISDSTLSVLGLRTNSDLRIAPALPARPPSMTIKTGMSSLATIRLYDMDSDRKGLPRGVYGAMIFTCISDRPPKITDNWRFFMNTTRTIQKFNLPNIPLNSLVWFSAAWVDSLLQPGKWSSAVSVRVPHFHANPNSNSPFHTVPNIAA